MKNSNPRSTVYLMGGFGNTLFQLNFAYRLAYKNHNVCLNTYFLEDNLITKMLLRWNTHDSLKYLKASNLITSFPSTNYLNALNITNICLARFLNINIFGYNFSGIESPDDLFVEGNYLGYFHMNNPPSLLLINKLRLWSALVLKKSRKYSDILDTINSEKETVLVHIRGGDFRKTKNSCSLETEYYSHASLGFKRIYAITNDKEYSINILKDVGLKYSILNTNDAELDFALILNSYRKIISNSTFAWWAAEAGYSNSKIIEPCFFYPGRIWEPITFANRHKIKF